MEILLFKCVYRQKLMHLCVCRCLLGGTCVPPVRAPPPHAPATATPATCVFSRRSTTVCLLAVVWGLPTTGTSSSSSSSCGAQHSTAPSSMPASYGLMWVSTWLCAALLAQHYTCMNINTYILQAKINLIAIHILYYCTIVELLVCYAKDVSVLEVIRFFKQIIKSYI